MSGGGGGKSGGTNGPQETLKVSARSNPNSVAGAMAGVVRQSGAVMVQVVGAGALNQAIKAVAIARGFVASAGIDLVCVPSFAEVDIDGERRTAIRLSVEDRAAGRAGGNPGHGPTTGTSPRALIDLDEIQSPTS
jgi:stage V sporulation protein S